MAKSAGRKSNQAVATVADRSAKVLTDGSANLTDRNIARRAYELYEERGCEHGDDVDDWLQPEREPGEFLEMPGLHLTLEQVHRLCGIERTMCQMVLDLLVDEKFLRVKSDGHYARLTTGHHPHPAKAALGNDYRKRNA